jgi:platelet-activating factor acetylhydrolase IB subunit alpha
LSSSRDHTIKLWDFNSGFCVNTLRGHTDWVKRVVVNYKGNLMASSSKDETIIVWSMA